MHTPGVLGPSHLRDAIFASDPERARLHQAFRVTLTAMIATLVLDGIATAIDRPLSVGLVGINVAMLASAVINDPTPREQQITLACAPIVASAAIVAGTYSAPYQLLRTTVLLALVFIAVLARRHGPRGLALGTIAMLACFFALFFRAAPPELPLMIAGVFVASSLGYIVRFWLLRDRPGALRRRRIEGLRNIIALTLEHAGSAVAAGGRSRDALQHIAAVRRDLGRIDEAALALEELPDAPGDGRVLTVELATQTVVIAVRHWLESAPETLHRSVARTLFKIAEHVRDDDTAALDRARQELLDTQTPFMLWLHDPLAPLLAAVRDLQVTAPDPTTAPLPTPTPTPSMLRPAIQATVAAALALLLGGLVSHDRAFWAVLAAFMVFTRANTLGAMLVRAWQRTVGTIAGVVVGLLVAQAAQGHTYLELGLVFVCMFVAYYSLQAAYAWMVGAFTTLVAVLYSLLGNFSPELLYLRVLETVVGASVGAVVAAVVFPTPTRPAIRNAMIDALTSLADHLELARREPPGAQLRASARAIDRKLRDLRAEVARAAVGPWLRSARDRAHLFLTFATVLFHARPLAAMHSLAADPHGPLQDLLRGLADNVRAVADRLAGRPGPRLQPLKTALEAARTAPADPALAWLTHLDEALADLDRDIITLDWSGPSKP